MSNTFILECNRFNSKVKTDDKLDWVNNIEPVQLRRGDQVSVFKAILNRRGASTQTIEIEVDLEEEILLGYYVNDSGIEASMKGRPWVYRDGVYTTGATSRVASVGYTDTPYMRTVAMSDANSRRLYPVVKKVTIKIGKGSYSVSNIADLITQQMSNGVMATPFDYKINNTLKENLLEFGLVYNGGFMDISLHTGPINANGTDDADLEFQVDLHSTGTYWDDYIKDENDITSLGGTNTTIRNAGATYPAHFFLGNDPSTADAYSSLDKSYIGASPSISWDINENRFFLNELHTPFTIPTIDAPDSITEPNADAGNTATVFKVQHTTVNPDLSCNPRVAVCGVWILNPAFKTCRTNSDVTYSKDIVAASAGNLPEVINTAIDSSAPYDPAVITELQKGCAQWVAYYGGSFEDCFSTDKLAQENWEKTIWYRLGFDRSQFGEKNRFKYKYMSRPATEITTRGLTTINDYDIKYAQASSGGGPNTFVQHSHAVHAYAMDLPTQLTAAVTDVYSQWRMETPTKPLVASSLPQLSSENAYYNVWSDIVPCNWFGTAGARMSLISNISLNYSQGDYVYSFSDNNFFTLTEDRVLSSVQTRIVQADGTIPDPQFFDPYTTIFYKVVRPQRSFVSNVATIDEKAKLIEKK